MIHYDTGSWGMWFILSSLGSVLPKACCVALPNACIALFLHYMCASDDHLSLDFGMQGVASIWQGYTFMLCFMLVFRSTAAYDRFWEGVSSVMEVGCWWLSSAESVFAFCSNDPAKARQVARFQQLYIRLVSAKFAVSLQRVCELDDDSFEILDWNGIDPKSREFFRNVGYDEKPEIILQWLNRLIVNAQADGTLMAPPPIAGRAFLEISRGKVEYQGLRNLATVPFPFPYAQLITAGMIMHWIITPLLASQYIHARLWCFVACFFVSLILWSLVFIAYQIDNPLGDDHNDLPVQEIMMDFNRQLIMLAQKETQTVPEYASPDNFSCSPALAMSWCTQDLEKHVAQGWSSPYMMCRDSLP
eukprot:TRINITY_DN821_c0_g1_i1.p1 TRINITY_DN821_c0_g1~~TRINITY_DN821_c0_g1_i1.p1  ORF type:complete len:360 (-),score=66.83 TRINITY_DN821_c0_g1_i1:67-1146(-)